MKMYVWTDHRSFLVVAHAESTASARLHVLKTLDDSTPSRRKVSHYVTHQKPTIRTGYHCQFAISETGDANNDYPGKGVK